MAVPSGRVPKPAPAKKVASATTESGRKFYINKTHAKGGAASTVTNAGTGEGHIVKGKTSAWSQPGETSKWRQPTGPMHGPKRAPKPVGAPARPQQVGFDVPKPVTAGTKAAAHFQGATSFGAKAVKSSPAIPALLLGTFLIVSLAKVRGGLGNLDIPKALFGGFIVAFVLTLLSQAMPQLALAFAALIFVGALLELGPKAFGGLNLTGKTTLPASQTGTQSNIFGDAVAANGGKGSDASTGTSVFPSGMQPGDTFTYGGATYVMH